MAFTSTEKMKIRKYMGWPERFSDSDSALELAIRAVDMSHPETEAEIRATLARCDQIWDDIYGARKRLVAAQAGNVTLPQGVELSELRGIGRQLSGNIASLLAVEIRHDVWGPAGPTFRTSGYSGPSSGGGGRLTFG